MKNDLQITEINRHISEELAKWQDVMLRADADKWTILGRPRGTKNKSSICDTHKEEILSLLDKNISYSGIARILGVHRLTVSAYVTKMTDNELASEPEAETMERARENRCKLTLDNIATLRDKGLDNGEIAKYYGMSRYAFVKNIKKLKTQQN